MKGSDLLTMSANSNGVTIDDCYASWASMDYDVATGEATYVGLTAKQDVYNDWTIVRGFQKDDGSGVLHTMVQVTRALDTEDNQVRRCWGWWRWW
jgi:hypothetical protein